jgi:hypothetical protein
MNVIGHQDVRMHRQPVAASRVGEILEEPRSIAIAAKDVLPIVAAQRDVRGKRGNEQAAKSGHGGITPEKAAGRQAARNDGV